MFNTNVNFIRVSQTWRRTKTLTHKLQTFINRCLRAIRHIKCQDKITNEEIWRRTGQAQDEAHIKRRKRDWLGHTLENQRPVWLVRHALKWNPRGKRRRSMETEGRTLGHLGQLEVLSRDRAKWRKLVVDLCSTRSTKV